MEIIWQSEIDQYASRVLKKHWPHVPNFGDITKLDPATLPVVDVVCGGFPCQPVSFSGRRGGQSDKRWLWPEFFRVVCFLRPRYVIAENVPGLLSLGGSEVLSDLASIGYDAEWETLSASAFGAPHKRERIFFIAYPGQIGRISGVFNHRQNAIQRDILWRNTAHIKTGKEWERWAIAASQAVDGEISASDFHSVDDGLSKELDEIGALGNAVVPQIVEQLGRMILTEIAK